MNNVKISLEASFLGKPGGKPSYVDFDLIKECNHGACSVCWKISGTSSCCQHLAQRHSRDSFRYSYGAVTHRLRTFIKKPPIQTSRSSPHRTGFFHRPRSWEILIVMLLVALGVVAVYGEFLMTGHQEVALMNEVRRSLRDGYVDLDWAEELDCALAGWAQSVGPFDVTLGPVFAFHLTWYLRDLAQDRHLLLMYSVLPMRLHFSTAIVYRWHSNPFGTIPVQEEPSHMPMGRVFNQGCWVPSAPESRHLGEFK
ncbi:MAG: hypothetical protein WBN92_06660 [Terriglobia bacterium]